MDRLRALSVFVRVVERGSFSAVARELSSTQGAISKQIAALEAELGVRLLLRTTRALALTAEGERCLEHARRLVDEMGELEESLRCGAQQLSGRLRVAASVGFGRLVLMPAIAGFLRAHPALRIDLRLNDGFIDIVEEGIDVAVRLGDLADSSLRARRIGSSHRVLLAHRDYLAATRRRRSRRPLRQPHDLAGHNCLVYTEVAQPGGWRFIAGPDAADPGSEVLVQVEGNLRTNSSEVIRAGVLAGLGIAHAPDWLFADALQSGEVVRLLPAWHAPAIPIHLVSPPQRRRSARMDAFADAMAGAVAGA